MDYVLNLRRDLPDARDQLYSAPFRLMLPSKVDLRPISTPVYDQKSLGSCTSQAACAAHEIMQVKTKYERFMPSRLFHYYCERDIQGTINRDSGATIRNSIKALYKYGVPPETMWPYRISDFKKKPPVAAYDTAKKHVIDKYERLSQTTSAIRSALAGGYPVLFGFSVYDSFMKVGKSGIVPLPTRKESVQGGHAVLICGYSDSTKLFTVRNSWGLGFGDKGYCYFPYNYITNPDLCFDFWRVVLL